MKKFLVISSLLLGVSGCTERQQFENPDLVDQNRVRPETITQPAGAETNRSEQSQEMENEIQTD